MPTLTRDRRTIHCELHGQATDRPPLLLEVFDSLHQVSVPTLIVVGSEDGNFLAAADVMARRIPSAQKLVLKDAGHAANMDAAEEFNAAVSKFLEAL